MGWFDDAAKSWNENVANPLKKARDQVNEWTEDVDEYFSSGEARSDLGEAWDTVTGTAEDVGEEIKEWAHDPEEKLAETASEAGEVVQEKVIDPIVEPIKEKAEEAWEAAKEQLQYYFGKIDPGQIEADPETAANIYDEQMQQALTGFRGKESPAETLAKLNLGRVAGAARRGMRRGGGPLSIATGLAAMGPEQARIAAAGGRAVGAEQQRIDEILGTGYGGMAKQDLARAMAATKRREAIDAANRGMYDAARADLNRKLGIYGVMGAQGLGKALGSASDAAGKAGEYLSGFAPRDHTADEQAAFDAERRSRDSSTRGVGDYPSTSSDDDSMFA